MKRIGDMNAMLMTHSLLAGAIRALNAGKELKTFTGDDDDDDDDGDDDDDDDWTLAGWNRTCMRRFS